MRAIIQKLNMRDPSCGAASENDILFVFIPPPSGLHLGDVVEFDHKILDLNQTAQNISTGATFIIRLRAMDIHDLRLPAAHGSLRFPLPERFSGA